jgi:hypothetical protein
MRLGLPAVLAISVAVSTAGCAGGGPYPLAPPLTGEEAASMDCRDLSRERARAERLRHRINWRREIDKHPSCGGCVCLGEGPGGGEADRSAIHQRIAAIEAVQAEKDCEP